MPRRARLPSSYQHRSTTRGHIRPVSIWPETLIPQVEVVERDPAVLLDGELGRLARVGVPLPGRPHDLRLLRHPDRGHLRPAGGGGPLQIWPHHLGVAVSGLELDHRDVIRGSERAHRPPERIPDLAQHRRRSDRHAPVMVHPYRGEDGPSRTGPPTEPATSLVRGGASLDICLACIGLLTRRSRWERKSARGITDAFRLLYPPCLDGPIEPSCNGP
jgi:hypothetical protein